MFKNIPGNADYTISLNGEVKALWKGVPEATIVNGKVTIVMYGKKRCFDVIWLGLIAHFEVNLPDNLDDIYFVDIATSVVKVACGKVMRFKRPIMTWGDLRRIPGYTNYGIAKNGKLYNLSTNEEVRFSPNNKYPRAAVYDPDYCCKRDVAVHRLVALAWCSNEDFITKPIVNHIDGNKANYHASNLEWCSFKHNTDHAVNTGLFKVARKYKVRDIETGEVREFGSFSKVCEEVGMDPSTKFKDTRKLLKPSLLKDRYEVKELEDDSPWMTKEEASVVKGLFTIKITHPDGTVDVHNTNLEIIKKYKLWGMSQSVKEIVRRMKEKHPELTLEVIQNVVVKPIQGINAATKEIVETDSIRDMARLTGVTFSSVRLALHRGEEYVMNGYAFRYKTDAPWSKNLSESKLKARPVRAISLVDGGAVTYSSIKSLMASGLGVKYNALIRAIKRNKPYRKHYFTMEID